MKVNKRQLVSEHLENISRDVLETHQDIIRAYIKGRHGIYALFRKGRLYYVGLASDLRNRLKTHLRDHLASTWDRFSIYLTVSNEHLRDLEALVLKIAPPAGNSKPGTFAASQNIIRAFERDIKNKQDLERDHLVGRNRPTPTQAKKSKTKSRKTRDDKPVLAKYVKGPLKLRMTYKGKLYKATVRRDGAIAYKGMIYNSPSHAAAAIKGHAANGWVNWKFQETPGDWVLLDTLRKKV
ncbi:MAG: hypothetical protein M0024_05895 [Nitrospiraceae bacterium]|nr:hypothetical protein [Nitrospiraceae bacterium]